MIDILKTYIWRSLPEQPMWETNPNLVNKVTADGKLCSFLGNTAVFLLNDDVKAHLGAIRDALHAAAPNLLAKEKLRDETFHMTLHDLANGSPEDPTLLLRMADAEQKARAIIAPWKTEKPIRMRATWTFNMVRTSIVLGLVPIDTEGWERLDAMYLALHGAVPIAHALTPHITLAYFRPGSYTKEELLPLRKALGSVKMEICLRMEDLVLQEFEDMNTYTTIE